MARPKKAKERTPLGVKRKQLDGPTRPGYTGRWINDKPGRIQAALEGGYQFVRDPQIEKTPDTAGTTHGSVDIGSAMARNVNSDPALPQKAYYMEISTRLYNQDQKEKQKPLDAMEAQIKGGKFDPGGLGKSGYVPKDGISITRQ